MGEHLGDPVPIQKETQMVHLVEGSEATYELSHVSWDGSKISKFPDLPSPPQWTATSVQLVATIDDELKKCWGALIDAKSIDAAVEARATRDKLVASILRRIDTRQQALHQLSSAVA